MEENVDYDEREDEFDIVSTCISSLVHTICTYITRLDHGADTVMQEDEDELTRRKDLEEDINIDVLSPHTDYPRRPNPSAFIPPNLGDEEGELVAKSVQSMEATTEWLKDHDGDGDSWEGFFISVDMLSRDEDDEE